MSILRANKETAAPAPARRESISAHAASVAQKIIDLEGDLEAAQAANAELESRARTAEGQVRGLEAAIGKLGASADEALSSMKAHAEAQLTRLSAHSEAQLERMTEQRDYYLREWTATQSKLEVAAKVVLDLMRGSKIDEPHADYRPKTEGQRAVARALNPPVEEEGEHKPAPEFLTRRSEGPE